MENFAVMEIAKQLGWSDLRCEMMHFRSPSGDEADVVLEAPDKRVVGVEIKASMDVSPSDFKGLRTLGEIAGKRFHKGILLYTGNDVIQYGRNLWAVPLASLWA
jgi:predicted AAA+ superfamily ATPase